MFSPPRRNAFALFALLACGLFAPSAESATWYVTPGGGGTGSSWADPLGSIGAGLAISASGDEIWVKSATYAEAITMKQGVALYGGFPASGSPTWGDRDWEANETIIDATGLNTHTVVGADDATLDGFTVTGGSAECGSGVYCDSSSPTLTNCTIAGNEADSGGGVYGAQTLTNCEITGTEADTGGGVCCDYSSPSLTNCTIAGNSGGVGGGLFCVNCYPKLTNCIL
jgi:hypothetical protein